MRGYRIPKASRKLDVVIVATRYGKSGKKLALGQSYVRRGLIWGDQVLLNRDELVQRLEGKQRVVTGRPAEMPGEFEVFDNVRLVGEDSNLKLHAGQADSKDDDLGLPLF